jgi:hypothetical protein
VRQLGKRVRQRGELLHGLTALEALKGKTPDKTLFSDKIKEAAMKRPQSNKENACKACS